MTTFKVSENSVNLAMRWGLRMGCGLVEDVHVFFLPAHGGGDAGAAAGVIVEHESSMGRGSSLRYSPSFRSTAASPSGWRAAFNPKMSASYSSVRVQVLPMGVVTKKK